MNNKGFQWDIIGHQKIVHFLQNSINNNKIAHAYLFTGPNGVGKTGAAENFAASLLCQENPSSRGSIGGGAIPCKKCVFCQQVFKKIHPDLIWIKKGKDKKNITIEQIRILREKLTRKSFLNSYKVAIIEGAEALNKEAWNAILKTLEEPSAKTVIILITANSKNLPATIISRCQLIKFLFVNRREIYDYFLNKLKLLPKKAEILSHLCQGRPGIGIKFFKDKKSLEKYEVESRKFFDIIKKGSLKNKFSHLDNLVKPKMNFLETRQGFQNLLSIWILVLRDCLLIKSSNQEFVVNDFIKQELGDLAQEHSLSEIKELLQKFIQTKNYLYYNINPNLAVENLILNMSS